MVYLHIPISTTQEIEILTFENACKCDKEVITYDDEKWLYIPNCYSEYRYVLGTVGKHPLITIGINPSTASPNRLDSTMRSVKRMACRNGFDSFIMLNIYAQRATEPKYLDNVCNEFLHQENMKAFRWVLENCVGVPSIWAAWGTTIEIRGYFKECLKDIINQGNRFGARWYMADKQTKNGHPHHPLYLRNDTKLVLFDIENYVKTVM